MNLVSIGFSSLIGKKKPIRIKHLSKPICVRIWHVNDNLVFYERDFRQNIMNRSSFMTEYKNYEF